MCVQLTGERGVVYGLVGNSVLLSSHRHVVDDRRRISSLGMILSGWSMSLCLLPWCLVRSSKLISLLTTFFFVPMIFRSSFKSVLRLFSVSVMWVCYLKCSFCLCVFTRSAISIHSRVIDSLLKCLHIW